LFVGSHLGDSQLVRIHTSPISDTSTPTLPIPADVLTVQLGTFSTSNKRKGKGRAWVTDKESEGCVLALNGTYIEVVDTWQNVGPILDAVLTDIDGTGQVTLVPPMVLILAENHLCSRVS
jgi:DNA damage-binding protein 1